MAEAAESSKKDKSTKGQKSKHALDGEIVTVHKGIAIYKTKASPYWFARVRDPKEGKYVVRSTKEKAQISARRRAEELAAEILGGHRPTPKEYSFKYYATRFVQKGYRQVESGERNANYIVSVQSAPCSDRFPDLR